MAVPHDSRPESGDLADFLAGVNLFGGIPRQALEGLAAGGQLVHFVRGDILMREGEAGECMYVVVSGRLRAVMAAPGGGERVLREIGPGETVGEMALISGAPRAATVRAVRDSELIKISAPSFDMGVCACPEALMRITRVVVDWLHAVHLDQQSAGSVRTIGVLAAGPWSPAGESAARLADALAEVGPVLHLDSRRFDEHLGGGAARDDIGASFPPSQPGRRADQDGPVIVTGASPGERRER